MLTGAPDSRDQTWHQVADEVFHNAGLDALCPPVGWLVGLLAAMESLGWHAAQLGMPGLPDPWLRFAGWGLVLLQGGALAYLFTQFQLGLIAHADRRATPRPTEDTFSCAFIYTILILAVPYLYATAKLANLDPADLMQGAHRGSSSVDPCTADPGAQEALMKTLGADLLRARRTAQESGDRRIDGAVAAMIAGLEPAVDAYLDWYFTVIGEYERLAALATGGFAELMAAQLEKHLILDTDLAGQLETLESSLQADAQGALDQAAVRLGQTVRAQAAASPCALSDLDLDALGTGLLDPGILGDLNRDATRAAGAAGAGAAAGALTAKLLAQQTGAAVAAKLAAKKAFQTAAALAGKIAAKKGGSILVSAAGATVLCAPSGPAAALCGVLAGAATWLAVDKTLVEFDEARLRETMRSEILDSIEAQGPLLAAAIEARHQASIDARAAAIQTRLERAFVPVRDGL